MGDAVAHEAAVLLELGFALAAEPAAAALARKVGPRAGQAGQRILHAGQRDLQHRLAGARPVGENLQDDLLPVDDSEAGFLLPVALLGGGKFLVEDDDVGAVSLGRGDQLGGLATADEKLGLQAVAQVDERGARDGQVEVLDELVQLREQLRALAGGHVRCLHPHQEGAGRGFLAVEKIGHGQFPS